MTELGRITFDAFGSVTSAQGPTGPAGSIGSTGPTGPQGVAGADGADGSGGGGSNAGFAGFEEFLHVPSSLADQGWFGGPLNLRLNRSGANTYLDFANNTANRLGTAIMSTGTTSTGYTYLASQAGSIPLNYGAIEWETFINLGTLGTGSQRYTFRSGIAVPNSGSAPTMGIWFSYADNVNSGNYQCHVTVPSGDIVFNSSTGPVGSSSSWDKLGFSITLSGGVDGFGQVIFKINGATVETLDVGDNGDIDEVDWYDDTFRGGIYSQIAKSVGTSDSILRVDYISFSENFISPR